MKNKSELLEKLLNDIDNAKAESELDVLAFPYSVRSGIEMRVRDAQANLGKLKAAYGTELLKNVVKVVLNSDNKSAEKFASLLTKEGPLAVPARTVYDLLTDHAERHLENQVFTTNTFVQVNQILHTTARTFNISRRGELQSPNPVSISSRDQLYDIVRGVVEGSYGGALNDVYITNQIVETGLKDKVDRELLVVVVPEKSGRVDNLLSGQTTIQIELDPGEEVDKSIAMKTYRRIYDSLKKQAIKTTKEDK
jgi:hypothetical protein